MLVVVRSNLVQVTPLVLASQLFPAIPNTDIICFPRVKDGTYPAK